MTGDSNGHIEDLSKTGAQAQTGDKVAIFGNFRFYTIVLVGRPRISRRPAVNYEEMATRYRMHYSAAGVITEDNAFVVAVTA